MPKRTAVLLVLACALVLPSAAGATAFGVAEDATKYADDGGLALDLSLNDVGMTQNRVAVFWDPDDPEAIQEKAFLDRFVPVSVAQGIRVIFAVYPARAHAIGDRPAARQAFARYLRLLVETYPQVRDYIVGNEPNQPRFWQPQFVGKRAVAGGAYERLLAVSYDALKAADPTIRVIGVGLSPRGNDRPKAKDNRSTSPVRFLAAMGRAYRASYRMTPLMDAFAYHVYPLPSNTQPLYAAHAWPNAGWAQLGRIKQAFWDAFHDTPQATLVEAGMPWEEAIQMVVDEVGWQVRIPADKRDLYNGRETATPVSPAMQAATYAQLVGAAACDPALESLDFFHLVDETSLEHFQSGLLLPDGTRRPSYDAVKQAIAGVGDGCVSAPVAWRHTLDVAGARAVLSTRQGVRKVEFAADEGFVARTFLLPGAATMDDLVDPDAVAALARATTIELAPYRSYAWRSRTVAPGACYRYGVVLQSAVNPERTHTFLTARFCPRP